MEWPCDENSRFSDEPVAKATQVSIRFVYILSLPQTLRQNTGDAYTIPTDEESQFFHLFKTVRWNIQEFFLQGRYSPPSCHSTAVTTDSGQVPPNSYRLMQNSSLLAVLLALTGGDIPNRTVPTVSVWRRGSESSPPPEDEKIDQKYLRFEWWCAIVIGVAR
jgi:hypothetical protein